MELTQAWRNFAGIDSAPAMSSCSGSDTDGVAASPPASEEKRRRIVASPVAARTESIGQFSEYLSIDRPGPITQLWLSDVLKLIDEFLCPRGPQLRKLTLVTGCSAMTMAWTAEAMISASARTISIACSANGSLAPQGR